MTASAPITERRYVVPLVLVTSLFFLWAIGVNLNDILIQHLKKAFGLTDFQSSLIQSAFFGGYFLAALPAGWLMQRLGYKRGILIGLAGLRDGHNSVHSCRLRSSLRILPLRSFRNGVRTIGSGSRRQSLCDHAGSGGKLGTKAESRAIIQRRRRRADRPYRLQIHSLRHRAHSRRTGRDETRRNCWPIECPKPTW